MTVLFDVPDLRRRGFVGFVPVEQLDDEPLQVPGSSGVYAVVREASDAPRFLKRSDAGWWKGKDPTVPVERLAAEWVAGVQTVCLGDATSLAHGSAGSLSSPALASQSNYGRLLLAAGSCRAARRLEG
jgi:hypothetical protein